MEFVEERGETGRWERSEIVNENSCDGDDEADGGDAAAAAAPRRCRRKVSADFWFPDCSASPLLLRLS
ncbi:hypothetical protein HAX54_032101 [Datura stramonium]|uniref:Uncharacterized protein n=1 Tax=Datura stramonium TaxID=4076 RepID=A0ABS8VB34_DATST|nr:hypothetical protein [Datura stramonium]